MWVVTRHQYGISTLASQETSGSVAKCRLFSQATLIQLAINNQFEIHYNINK